MKPPPDSWINVRSAGPYGLLFVAHSRYIDRHPLASRDAAGLLPVVTGGRDFECRVAATTEEHASCRLACGEAALCHNAATFPSRDREESAVYEGYVVPPAAPAVTANNLFNIAVPSGVPSPV